MSDLFDSLSSSVILLIPLAIFIVRFVVQLRMKNEEPPRIPVHFEDDKEEEMPAAKRVPAPLPKRPGDDEHYPYNLSRGASEYLKGLAAQGVTVERTPKPAVSLLARATDTGRPSVSRSGSPLPARGENREPPRTSAPEQRGLSANLNRLSPLKQAVVMAEILGPPKGLR